MKPVIDVELLVFDAGERWAVSPAVLEFDPARSAPEVVDAVRAAGRWLLDEADQLAERLGSEKREKKGVRGRCTAV
jgi:hypothetical protein